MVEQVSNFKLYHVTLTKPYKEAFVANQSIKAGSDYNPFFGFYEGSREYPVTQADGNVTMIKAVAFLRQARDGLINAPQLGTIAAEVATHYVMLCRELLMEEIRQNEFSSEPPSRQRCLFGCGSLAEAQYWNKRIGENGKICELTCSGTIHRADARLLLGDSEPLSVTRERARAYWRGDLGQNPEMETLFVGDATVSQFGL
jgi:Protein of unknown function (DUF2441)